MGTPHINAKDGALPKTVLMPGDPKRAEWIANTFLTDVVKVTDVRNIFGFTGYYNGKKFRLWQAAWAILQSVFIVMNYTRDTELKRLFGLELVVLIKKKKKLNF